jgi:hypothetical protein
MIPILFFIFLSIAVVSFITALINLLLGARRIQNMAWNADFRDSNGTISKTFLIHIICAIFYVISSIGTAILGIAWIVQAIKGV